MTLDLQALVPEADTADMVTGVDHADRTAARALALLDQGDFAAASNACDPAIRALPLWHMPYFIKALALHGLGDCLTAVDLFLQSARCNPYFGAAYDNAAQICLDRGLRAQALEIALAMERHAPGQADNRFRIGSLYLLDGDYKTAQGWMDAGLNSPVPQRLSRMLDYGVVSRSRLELDRNQIAHLCNAGQLHEDYQTVELSFAQALRDYPEERTGTIAADDWDLPDNILSRLAPYYRRMLHLAPCPRLAGPAVNPALEINSIVDAYFEKPEPFNYVVVDDLLTADAVAILIRYFNLSTIWHNDSQKGRNYIGAYRDMGLMTPLVDQIIGELQDTFDAIVGALRLREIWAYRLVGGATAIGAHADFSETNINVWLTPDAANLRPGTGGLTLYEAQSPGDWGFKDYNDDPDKIAKRIANARKIDIPYRLNRATIFNSAMFHASQPTYFANGFTNNRINLTFLYGER
ncbi:phytanoyl-CoA dioxygenase family protein [Roseibium alexandrii]|uniref:Tetratricopeptide repeat protein n=1 Tax=Roseibium alexandrii (strain DSM 17067 / NCIMB 14079 / DFL-11) TaxID=244592 RepID=A0A5E8H1H8_ROSAD|nr:hypothetical protein [Roseibium alexandrii]EEE45826.1 hypothetical protein SADFL11_3115 [Roseibium alexandrii DFL-11]